MYGVSRLLPEGERVAVMVDPPEASPDIWIHGFQDDTWSKLTNVGSNRAPLWTPDGAHVVYTSGGEIYRRRADFSGERERLLTGDGFFYPLSFSPDGDELFLHEMIGGGQQRRMLVLPMDGDGTTRPLLDQSGQFNQRAPMISPDGGWLAYVSDQEGISEVYVTRYPGPAARHPISNDGGIEPLWNPDGEELFYRKGRQMIAARLEFEPVFRVEREVLFEGDYFFSPVAARTAYDYDPRSQRFLMARQVASADDSEEPPVRLNVVLNWFEELKRLVPTGGSQ